MATASSPSQMLHKEILSELPISDEEQEEGRSPGLLFPIGRRATTYPHFVAVRLVGVPTAVRGPDELCSPGVMVRLDLLT